MGLGKAGAGWGHSLGDAGSCPSRLPGASSSCPLPPVLVPRQAVGLDRLLFLSSSLWAERLTPVRAVGLALPLWLLGLEDRPGQENSQARGPWHSPRPAPARPSSPGRGSGRCWGPASGRARLPAPGCPAAAAPWASVSAWRRWQGLARAVRSGEGGVSGLFLGPPRVATLSRGPGRPSWP